MLPKPEPNVVCPACGGPNACAPACSGDFATPCWCTEVTVNAAALAALPAEARGQACLCRRCLVTAKAG
ncbi:MAG: cysteine-rich CWC family protein [Casimicrobiaceae bacterium]